MKKAILLSALWLISVAASAQIITASAIEKLYADAVAVPNSGFSYEAHYANGLIVQQTVYRNQPSTASTRPSSMRKKTSKAVPALLPFKQFSYTYDSRQRLVSRTMAYWNPEKGEWAMVSRHDYAYHPDCFTVDYSVWSPVSCRFRHPRERVVFSLLPDNTVCEVSVYQRRSYRSPYKLTTQFAVVGTDSSSFLLGNRP